MKNTEPFIVTNSNIVYYHGTSESNYNKIILSGYLKVGKDEKLWVSSTKGITMQDHDTAFSHGLFKCKRTKETKLIILTLNLVGQKLHPSPAGKKNTFYLSSNLPISTIVPSPEIICL